MRSIKWQCNPIDHTSPFEIVHVYAGDGVDHASYNLPQLPPAYSAPFP